MVTGKFLSLLASHLQKIVKDIESGNCNITEEETQNLLEYISRITDRSVVLSKEEACKYLNISRATFDRYVKNKEIPAGIKRPGFKEIGWQKRDLDKFIEEKKYANNKEVCHPNLRGKTDSFHF